MSITAQALLQQDTVEIDQQAELVSAKAQIGKYLGFMNRYDLLDRLEFDDELFRYDEIHQVSAVQLDSLICHR